ncbi:hypothetical protein MAM1_0023d01958 [Mucor ambiguus]|uniref:Uncharacterized protein n=1 Tax=Mucor ambiguus TaxID=91626 RepID=A0A0C9M6R4_9FUNG|nr:hypothetical protein MAM1_0023d01958 [Mucor ambiguus]
MKLRDKKKRVVDNIKQQDVKPAFTIAESLTPISHGAEAFDIDIKQEDTEEHSSTLQQSMVELDKADYYYCCDICGE